MYSLGRLTLAPGDALLLMSDGFPELFDCNGQMLGYDRVAGVFAEVAHRSPDVVIAHMASASEAWAAQGATESASEDEDHRDDITFVALRVTG